MANWIVLFAAALVGLVGVVLAVRGGDSGMALHGLLFLAFAVVVGFGLAGRMAEGRDD